MSKALQKMFLSKRGLVKAAVISAAILLVLALILPVGVKLYLNHFVFKDMGAYRGHVERIRLNLLEGAYTLIDLKVVRKSSDKDIPFFQVEELWIYINPKALMGAELSFVAKLVSPQLNFMDAQQKNNQQTGEGGTWLDAFESIVPTNLSELKVEGGTLAFKNLDSHPVVDIEAHDLKLELKNLTNLKNIDSVKSAKAVLYGQLLHAGEIDAEANFNPKDYSDFDCKIKISGVELKNLDDFSQVYANLDFESGKGDVYSELTAEGGQVKGYIKPLFEDVNILSWEQDVEQQADSPVQFLWEGAVGFFKTLFTNFGTDKVATQIEIEGTVNKAKVSVWQALFGIVKNAFGKALQEGFDSTDSARASSSSESDESSEDEDERAALPQKLQDIR